MQNETFYKYKLPQKVLQLRLKILPFTAQGASPVVPCDHCPALSQGGNRNVTRVRASAIRHIHSANTAHFSPLH